MTVEKAIEHLNWRLSSHLTKKDIDSFNTIIEYVNEQDKLATTNHTMFAKLMLHEFIRLARTESYTAGEVLNRIEQILAMRMVDIIEVYRSELPFYKFEVILSHDMPKFKENEFQKIRNWRIAKLKTKQRELLKSLKTKYTTEDAISFIEHQVNRLVTRYKDVP